MFDWLGDALSWVGESVSDVTSVISEGIWDMMLSWAFNTLYSSTAAVFKIQQLVQAGVCAVPDLIFAVKPYVSGTDYVADGYAAGTWNYAFGE